MSYKVFFFLLLLFVIGVWGYLRYEAGGKSDSYFNQVRRYSLGKSETWRWVLGLNKVGDAKGQYLSDGEPIVIEVVTGKNVELNEEALRNFAGQVEKITARKITIISVDTIDSEMVNDKDLPAIIKGLRRHKQYGQPNIFVLYVKDFEGSDQGPSKPFNEFGILVSDQKLRELTSNFGQSFREYMPAVMLHSFGYQIGLTDNPNPECIMQEAVLRPTRAIAFYGKILPSQFCAQELEQANSIRASLQ